MQRTSSEWRDILDAAGVPNAPMQTIAEVLAHPQTKALGMMQRSPGGEITLLGLPLSFDGVRPPFRHPPPALGAHTREIMRSAGSAGRGETEPMTSARRSTNNVPMARRHDGELQPVRLERDERNGEPFSNGGTGPADARRDLSRDPGSACGASAPIFPAATGASSTTRQAYPTEFVRRSPRRACSDR